MTNELIPTGYTYDKGRIAINTLLSGSSSTLSSSGMTFENIITNNAISGGTFYSGSTELRDVFGISKYSYSSSTYEFTRTITDSGKLNAKLVIKDFSSNIEVDIAPLSMGKFFKFQEYIQALHNTITGSSSNGSIHFNHLVYHNTGETISVNGYYKGQTDRLDYYDYDTISYITGYLPDITISAVTMTYIAPASNWNTGVTRTITMEGLIF